ncbi:MAG: hypothetical protein M3464_11035 [Chloroflexota bacterium]|nr:hypothetical protein [Chloroflexota bacterium]
MQPRRLVIEQEGDGGVDRPGIDHMEVVEDERHVGPARGELVDQGRHDRLDRWGVGRMQQGEGVPADLGPRRPRRGDDVGPEERGVVVARIERNPGRRSRAHRARRQPLREQ